MTDQTNEGKCFDAQSVYDTWIFANNEGTITIRQTQLGEDVIVIIPSDCVESVVYMLRSERKKL